MTSPREPTSSERNNNTMTRHSPDDCERCHVDTGEPWDELCPTCTHTASDYYPWADFPGQFICVCESCRTAWLYTGADCY